MCSELGFELRVVVRCLVQVVLLESKLAVLPVANAFQVAPLHLWRSHHSVSRIKKVGESVVLLLHVRVKFDASHADGGVGGGGTLLRMHGLHLVLRKEVLQLTQVLGVSSIVLALWRMR